MYIYTNNNLKGGGQGFEREGVGGGKHMGELGKGKKTKSVQATQTRLDLKEKTTQI